jgi:hypothetical protein
MDSLLSSRIPLISPKESPVPLFREFSPNQLIRCDIPIQSESKFLANHEKFPANSRISGNFAGQFDLMALTRRLAENRRLTFGSCSDQTRIEASTSVVSTTGADSKSAARPTRPKRQNEANRESGCLSMSSFKQFEA